MRFVLSNSNGLVPVGTNRDESNFHAYKVLYETNVFDQVLREFFLTRNGCQVVVPAFKLGVVDLDILLLDVVGQV